MLYFQLAARSMFQSDLHSKHTLRPHHVWYGRHPISDRWD